MSPARSRSSVSMVNCEGDRGGRGEREGGRGERESESEEGESEWQESDSERVGEGSLVQ